MLDSQVQSCVWLYAIIHRQDDIASQLHTVTKVNKSFQLPFKDIVVAIETGQRTLARRFLEILNVQAITHCLISW